MKNYRNILSLFILAAYTLFLFHDYIPHTHVHAFPVKQQADIHSHSTDNKHTTQNSLPDDQEQEDEAQLSELAFDDHHQHHLLYRKSSQNKIFFPHTSHAAIFSDELALLTITNICKENYTNQGIAYKSPQLYATHQLRAPPMSV